MPPAVATNTKKVDWRNYDYSEGPPKPLSTTRDVNPYSKRFDNGHAPLNSISSLSNSEKSFVASSLRTSHNSHDIGNDVPFSDGSKHLRVDTTANDNGMKTSGSLMYRPAKCAPTPDVDEVVEVDDDDDEEEFMRIPKVKKYAENLIEKEDDETSPFDQPKVKVVTPQNGVSSDKKMGFEEVWQEDEDDLDKESTIDAQPIVSDDDDDIDEVDEAEEDNDDYDESESINMQFDDFAGDRSKASTTNDYACSDDSVGKMDVTMAVAPVSILKSSGRFESVTRSSGSIGSNSAASRRNNFERTQVSQGVDDQITVDDSTTQDIDATPKRNSERRSLELNYRDDDKASEEMDEDSIFEFKKMDLKGTKSNSYRRASHGAGGTIGENDDDDTSIDDVGKTSPKKRVNSLKDRTKQAWSVRNRATAAAVTNPGLGEKRESVRFGNTDTIREFTPSSASSSEEDSEDDETTYTEYTEMDEDEYDDDDTFAGRSMHSLYTKSNESETEDMIKDFLLIGRGHATNPGRRQLKYKKGKKEEYEKMKKVRFQFLLSY